MKSLIKTKLGIVFKIANFVSNIIPTRTRWARRRWGGRAFLCVRKTTSDREKAIQMRLELNLTIRKIAERFGRSPSTVHAWMKEPVPRLRTYLSAAKEVTLQSFVVERANKKEPVDLANLIAQV